MKKKGWGKKSTPKKKLGIGSPVFCSFSFTLTHGHVQAGGGAGGGHSYSLLAMWLDYMGFAMEPTKEWKLGRGAQPPASQP